MKFKVDYSDSNFGTAKTIEAENHIDAAKKYYQTLTRNIDCEIIVQPKGLRGRSNTQKFLTSELFSKLIKLGQKTNLQPKTTTIEINPDFDRSKLDDVALKVFNNIKKYFPEWLPFISNNKNWDTRFDIEIPSPQADNHNLYISTAVGEVLEDEIEISFGYPPINTYLDHPECITIEEKLSKIEKYYNAIITEELITVTYILDKFRSAGGLKNREELNKLLSEGKVEEAYSWNGTYDFLDKDKLLPKVFFTPKHSLIK